MLDFHNPLDENIAQSTKWTGAQAIINLVLLKKEIYICTYYNALLELFVFLELVNNISSRF